MLPAAGKVTARANAVATAASTADPPACKTSRPTSAATPSEATTMPRLARVGSELPPTVATRRVHVTMTAATRERIDSICSE